MKPIHWCGIRSLEFLDFVVTLTRARRTWARLRAIMRFKPYDTTTEEGRARERLRRVGLSALSSAAARGLGLGASLITVPLTASYLGAERYGLWMTVLSVAGLLSMADLGIGYGVMTLLAEAHGRGDRLLARKLVSNATRSFPGSE